MSSSFCAHAEEAALILANVDLNGTMGIAYIGGTISCMYAPPLLRTSGALTTLFCGGQDLRRDMYPNFPLLPLSAGEGRRVVPQEYCEPHTPLAVSCEPADDRGT